MMFDTLSGRPRILNVLHALRLTPACSSTTREELACLSKYADGRHVGIEIGTHMGVSAAVIAEALATDGVLWCVDPWIRRRFMENPSRLICMRELARRGVSGKIRYARGFSTEVRHLLPGNADFIFVDGDHSRSGIATDWDIVQEKLAIDGVVCFHDTSSASASSYHLESVDYFRDEIVGHVSFEHLETCHTLNVLRRVR